MHAFAVQGAHRTETRFSATLALTWSLSRISRRKSLTAHRTAPASLAAHRAGALRANPPDLSRLLLAGVSRAIWTTLMAVSSDGLRVPQTISILISSDDPHAAQRILMPDLSDGPRAGHARQR
jgi:hypothetical protein